MLIRDSNSASLRKPSSYSVETYRDKDGVMREQEYIKCKHCQTHFPHKPGTDVWQNRGWCGRCGGFLCGDPVCMAHCIPSEVKLDFEEDTKTNYDDLIRQLINEGALIL